MGLTPIQLLLDLTEVISRLRFLVTGENTFSINPNRSGFYIGVGYSPYEKSFGSSPSGGATYNDITVILL